MLDEKPVEITVRKSDEERLQLTLHWDSDLFDYIEAFKVILYWLTFTPEAIKEVFPEEEE